MDSDFQRTGSGTPVVLIHGIQASGRVWAPVIDLIAAAGHEVLVPTLAGHRGGPALGPDVEVSLAALVDDLEARLDRAGIRQAHLVGNSLGGWVALELSRRGRALSVTVLSPAGGWARRRDLRRVIRLLSMGRKTLIKRRAWIVRRVRRPKVRRAALRLAMERGDLLTPEDVNEFILDIEGCVIFHQFVSWVRLEPPLVAEALASPAPVLVAWGEEDRTLPFKRYSAGILAAVPGATSAMLPGVGHVPMYDDPQLVATTVTDFVSTQENQGEKTPMSASAESDLTINGKNGPIAVRHWSAAAPDHVVVIAHGYAEHSGRYAHVAEALAADGASAYAPDLYAHGRTAAPGKLGDIDDFDKLVDDVAAVIEYARAKHPGLALTLLGHSLGGIVATRYTQRYGDLDALVLSGPVIGGNPAFSQLLAMDPIPEVPLDPAGLSRDPAVGEAYAADPLVYHGPFLRSTLQSALDAVALIPDGPSFGALPVLYLHGELDPLAPLDLTKPVVESLADSEHLETHIYPGAMHEVFNETNRDEVIGHLVAFVARQPAAAKA